MSEQSRSASRKGRKLTLRARAARQEQTRARIVEATVELHRERGPLATTISAVAERAGVERLTVYRNFPDQAALHAACTRHFFALNPPPSLADWAVIPDPQKRLRHALQELYAYWEATEPMYSSVLADHQHDPARAGGAAVAYIERARETLLAAWPVTGRGRRQRLRAAIGHAVHFSTWQTLAHQQGLAGRTAATMMAGFVEAAGTTLRNGTR